MKKLIFFYFLIVVLTQGCNIGSKVSADDYNDKIVREQIAILKSNLNFSKLLSSSDIKGARKALNDTKIQCESSIEILSTMEPLNGDSKFRDKTLELFRFYKRIFTNDYKTVLDIIAAPPATQEGIERIYAITAAITLEEEKLHKELKEEQFAFAKKHRMAIVKEPDAR
jgi:hypothetical protein